MAEPVDIILLSYNRLDFLAAMVETLEQRTVWPYRLTIVDNASGPATRQWLREHAGRFRQIVWNASNEHLGGLQAGIAATDGELFVVSDADLLVSEPVGQACWLTRLVELAERHGDFGLLGVRLDSVSEARNAHLQTAALIDGEVLEAASGVWLNLIRRAALRIPYMSDGITGHAIRRAGYRVGVAADIYASHLGDDDPERHPDYLARKQMASGWHTTYPEYPELARSGDPPTLLEFALAAPVLEALARHQISPSDTIELCAADPILRAADPSVDAYTVNRAPAGAPAVALIDAPRAVASAFSLAREWVVVLGSPALPEAPPEWSLVAEYPGPHPVVLGLARIAGRARWRRRLLYSTSEHREQWLSVFRAGCFGEDLPLRVYVLRREPPLAEATGQRPASLTLPARGLRLRRARTGTLVTKLRRLLRAEWLLFRGHGR